MFNDCLMERESAGYREIEHTADWELEVWGPDLTTLLEQAARGMYHLSGMKIQEGSRQARRVRIRFPDAESLLISFLGELLFLAENEGMAFDEFELKLQGERLTASMKGAPLISQDKEIKAVTYHNLQVRNTGAGLAARIVFDV